MVVGSVTGTRNYSTEFREEAFQRGVSEKKYYREGFRRIDDLPMAILALNFPSDSRMRYPRWLYGLC